MRKLLLGLGILLVIAMVLPVMAVPAVQKATGGGWYSTFFGEKVTNAFTAITDENGIVKGQFQAQYRQSWGTVKVDVTELIVTGNRADIGGVITSISSPDYQDLLGENFCVSVVDNGEGKGVIDKISSGWEGGVNAAWCNTNAEPIFDFQGNIQVS
jgi:hypothetical protein